MKKVLLVVGMLAVYGANARMVYFEGVDSSTTTTGDLLGGADHLGLTTNVAEIAGLGITAWSGGVGQTVKTLVDSMGIDSGQVAPEHIRLDDGESLTISLDKDIEITRLDFNHFDVGETVVVSFEEMFDLVVAHSNLSNKISDFLYTNITVSAGTKIEYYVVGETAGIVGLDGIDLVVLEDPGTTELSIVSSNGTVQVAAEFNGQGSSNVLQRCDNLASNVWTTVSAPFASSTNWIIETTDKSGFFRVIAN